MLSKIHWGSTSAAQSQTVQFVSPPIPVVQNDYFELEAIPGAASDLTAIRTFFSIEDVTPKAQAPDSFTAASGTFTQSLTISGVPVSTGTGGGAGTITSINSINSGAVTIAGAGTVAVSTAGNTITVSGVASTLSTTFSGVRYDPLITPEFPSTFDDEFDRGRFNDNGKWTLWDPDNRGIVQTYAHGWPNLLRTNTSGVTGGDDDWSGVYQAAPPTTGNSWSVDAKVTMPALEWDGIISAGIMLGQNLSGAPTTSDFYSLVLRNNVASPDTRSVIFRTHTDYTDGVGTTLGVEHTFSQAPANVFLRLVWDAANTEVHGLFSFDGIDWRVINEDAANFTPAQIGIVSQNARTSASSQGAAVEFFRVVTSGNAPYGYAPAGRTRPVLGRMVHVVTSGTTNFPLPSDISVTSITAVTGTFTTGVTIGGGTTHIFPDSIRTGSIVASGVINAQAGITVSGVPVQTQVAISGTRVSYFSPDAPPVSGTSVDDEFDQNPIGRVGSGGIAIDSKWTLFDPDGLLTSNTLTAGVFADGFHLGTNAASADNTIIGYYQTIPAYTSWQFVVKVGPLSTLGGATGNTYDDIVRIGLFIADNNIVGSPTTADLATVSLKIFSSNQFGFAYEEWTDYNSPTTTNIAQHIREVSVAANEQAIVQPGNVYLRIGWRASDNRMDTQYSLDGMTFVDLNANLTTHPFTTGPTKIGIFKSIGTAENPTGRFYFFRMNNTSNFFRDDPTYGRRIRVS
jgi:hypothetical protein